MARPLPETFARRFPDLARPALALLPAAAPAFRSSTTRATQPPQTKASPEGVSVASQAFTAGAAALRRPSVTVMRTVAGVPSLCGGLVHSQS